jgi:hypothetical protein
MNSVLNRANTRLNNVITNTATPIAQVLTSTADSMSSGASAIGVAKTSFLPYIFVVLLIVFILLAVFYKQIMDGINSAYDNMRKALGATDKEQINNTANEVPVVTKPVAPQDEMETPNNSIVEKVMPGRKEVFNISQNRFTYYDAEPLCKALGAELATYENVKEAWDKGGDWCNYGWVKGQVAAYPTQADTWEKLQKGPEDQRGACGRPGVNGGHFDNPELRFGVNCYGVKPSQSKHDADTIAKGEGQPFTPGALEFNKKVSQYKSEADHIGILPFNGNTWN